MTTRTSTIKDSHGSTAEFRALAQSIHDHFAAAGFVQTADSGQINLTTVTIPGGASTSAGYEIWRFADALQTTSPIYFKIEYGTGVVGAGCPAFWVTVGSGSDGAGVITATLLPNAGTITVRKLLGPSGSVSGSSATWTSYFHYGAADGSGFAWCQWLGASVNTALGSIVFSIERFRNADGTANGDGFNLWGASGTNATGVSFHDGRFHAAGAVQPAASVASWPAPTGLLNPLAGAATTLLGTTMYPVPVFTGIVPRTAGPSQFFMLVGKNDLGVGAVLTLSHYGTSRNWIALGPAGSTAAWGSIDASSQFKSLIMRND